ncbi:MAG: hypothetical protein AAGD32_16725 [Planctomycetota bacterium]
MAQTSLHDETLDGDLSGDISAPTALSISAAGDFTVTGSVFNSDQDDTFAPDGEAGDLDLFALTIGDGLQVDRVWLDAFSGAGQAFIGVQEGPVFTVNTANNGIAFPPVASGFALVDADEVGSNILRDLIAGALNVAPAFPLSNPIEAGTFSFAVQNTGVEVNGYALNFEVTEVPEPAGAAVLAGLGAVLAMHRRGAGPPSTRSDTHHDTA